VAINNKPVLGNEPQYLLPETAKKYSPPVLGEAGNNFEKYIFQQATHELDMLEDGTYILRVDRLVIDDEGKVAYYQPGGIELFMGSNESKPAIHDDTRMAINQKLASILDGPVTFKPAVKDGKPVNVRMSLTKYAIEVKNHKSKLVGRGGC
jgi:hypothetical protein